MKLNNDFVYLKQNKFDGIQYGVFANKKINIHTVFMHCPFYKIVNYDYDNDNYSYQIENEKGIEEYYCVMGYGMLLNHKNIPNANWYIDHNERLINFYSINDINKDEEICINYLIHKSYKIDEFNLKEVLKTVNIDKYSELTFYNDLSDLKNFLQI
jgi:hypothetical protein